MSVAASTTTPEPLGLIRLDPWLRPFEPALRRRLDHYHHTLARIRAAAGGLPEFALGYRYFGFHRGEKDGQPGVWYREWAPSAIALALIGDFNGWDRISDPLHPAQ